VLADLFGESMGQGFVDRPLRRRILNFMVKLLKIMDSEPDNQHLDDSIAELQRELVRTRTQLEEKEALFNSITEHTLAGYWIWHIKENNFFISPHLKAMLGYGDEELENSVDTINKLMHPSDLPDTYALLGKHLDSNGKIPFEIEVRYKHKNGSIVWVICSGNIVKRDEHGKPAVMIGCHLDNTQLKQVEGIQKYMKELERKNVEMEQFAYVASHDLQEPLNTIQGFISLLMMKLEGTADPEVSQYLSYIQQSSERMSNLIKGLLEYSRIGKETLMSKVNCNLIVEGVKADLALAIKENDAVIEADELPSLMGYDTDLRILFRNLVNNALTFRSNEPPQIKISCTRDGEFWKFSVADNGIGIDPAFNKKIFKLYQRLHPRGQYEGYGLGLAQCYKIVTELHNGHIWVEANKPSGSIFNFTIPQGI
jgi:PAS domain S-box-containing protein